jgi:uncharacterized membrane protein YjgN (DUF898 family)
MSDFPAPPARFPVRFTGDRRAFWRMLVRGSILLAMTLGIYRFWLTTDIRSSLWSSTEIERDSLEYSGTAVELLIGFLFALAILITVYTAFFIAALDLGTLGELSGIIGFLLLFALGQYAVFRARRYRLSRTILRGLRFHQDGSAIRYAVCAMIWWGVTIVTLGLAYPWKESRLERYKMKHSYYGDLQGRFDGVGFSLFLRGLPMWLLIAIPLLAGLTAIAQSFDIDAVNKIIESGGDDALARIERVSPGLAGAVVFAVTCTAISVLFVLLFYPIFQAMTLRWWLNGVRFDVVTLRSRLGTAQVYGVYLRFAFYALLYVIVLAIVAIPLAIAFGYAVRGEASILRELAVSLAGLAGYVAAMLGLSAIYRATVLFSLWKISVETLEIDNLAALANVKAAGRASSPVGEGLADALHVGGI